MEKIWNNAKFIYTEFQNYFDASKNPWRSRIPYVNQHCEIVDNNGLPMFWSDFDIVSGEKTELIFSIVCPLSPNCITHFQIARRDC